MPACGWIGNWKLHVPCPPPSATLVTPHLLDDAAVTLKIAPLSPAWLLLQPISNGPVE
jgi:hypothetical protein